MDPNDRLLTIADVEETVGFCKVTIYKMMGENRFPKQVRLGPNKVAWLRSEVLGWIKERAEERQAA